MNNQQIKVRLIEASLTDNIPPTPPFKYPSDTNNRSVLPHWAGYAAATVAIAIILPLSLRHSQQQQLTSAQVETEVMLSEDEISQLEGAFTMVNRHFATSSNLIDIVQ